MKRNCLAGELIALSFLRAGAQSQPQLGWPVAADLNEDVFFLMHVDHNPSQGATSDYRCNDQYTYDGHTGTDISALNFRQMDEGIPILAAADGIVTWTRHDQFDRNYWPPYRGDPNGVIVEHADGSNSQYWHLRQNSVTVRAGEVVKEGQVIAYMESSGATPIPHLHFEVRTPRGGSVAVHDPFAGECNQRPGLWKEAFAYPGDSEFRLLDADIFMDANLKGSESNNFFGETVLKDRPVRPVVLGIDEPHLGVWIQLQGTVGTQYVVRVLRPTGEEFAAGIKAITRKAGVQWHVLYWDWNTRVGTSDQGSWTIRIEHEQDVVGEIPFNVGEQTVLAPRFMPIAGRSFLLDGTSSEEFLQVEGGTGAIDLDLVGAPDFVHLDGNRLTVEGTGTLDARNRFFTVVATDESGRTDTARYHLVDLLRPFRPVALERGTPVRDHLTLHSISPSPFSRSARVSYSIQTSSMVRIELVDVSGRIVRLWYPGRLAPGRHELIVGGDDLAAGIYFCRIFTASSRAIGSLVKAR